MKISEIKDIEVLQQMFQNASDMHERSELRAAIRALREQEMNKLSPQMELTRTRSLRRSRRMRNNGTTESLSTTKENSTRPQPQKLGVTRNSAENLRHNSSVNPMVLKRSEKGDTVFGNELDRPQTFVRNSLIRQNRRSRKSTSSRSSDLESGVHKASLPEMSDPPGNATMKLSEQRPTPGGVRQEHTASSQAPVSPVTYSSAHRRNPPSEYTPSRKPNAKVESEGRKLSKENESPGISPYRSPSLYQSQITETPRRTSVSISQGATCQYKTITTSFRGPAWKPVSPSDKTAPLTGHQTNNSNNKTHSEWPQPDRGPSNWTGPDKRHASLTESSDFSGSSAHPKTPTRVFKALGKKLFSTKAKTPSASGQQTSLTRQPSGGSNPDAPRAPLEVRETPSYRQFDTTKRQSARLSPFQQRKNVFENGAVVAKTPSKVSYSWNRPRGSRHGMADVAPLSRPSSRETGNFSPAITGSSPMGPEVDEDNDDAIGELEGLLKQYTDPEKRVKIRETIRHLKQSLQEGDPSSSGSKAANKSVLANSTKTSPQQHEEDHGAVEVTVALQKTPSSSLSRFAGRSTSLRTPKPSYQPSPQAVNRASSFKLSRPKDFIVQKVGSSSQLTKVPETPPEDFKEYADSLNNNLPDYKPGELTPQRTAFTHNKTASPFAASSQGSYKKYAWTPPSTSSGQTKPAFSNTTLSATVRSSVASAGLRRSESTKECRSTDFQPIGVVPGNLRRSKSILERILGQKLDAEKSPSTPFQSGDKKRLERVIPKTDPTDKKLQHKPPIHTNPKRESPTSTPRAAPRSLTPTKAPTTSYPPKAPSPLARASRESPHKEEKVELSPRVSSRSSSTSCSSRSSSNSSGDHVYEIAGSDSEISSSDSSDRVDSPTLSEIIQESRRQDDNETNTEDHTSSVVLSTDRDKREDLESDLVFEEVEKVSFEGQKREIGKSDQGSESKQSSKSIKHKVVLQPLTSHKVCEPETARVFNVQVVRPVGLRSKTSTESNQVPSKPPTPAQSVPLGNKETKKSSSSLSSITSSDSEEEVLSDDEESSADERNMDRYSSRALQSRVSVKSQILAKEDDMNANTKTTANTTSRRLRDRHNKPLNTGDDLKTRMQKFKNQTNGDEKAPVSKRNGGVKVTGSSGKKIDLSKFEKDGENTEISTSAGKTTVSIKTPATKSTRRSTSREESSDIVIDTESTKENLNGTSRKVSSSSSADDTDGRIRRARRGKTGSETENGLNKLEKASSIATDELKQLGKTSIDSNEVVVSTKKSRDRTKKVNEDMNNNTKSSAGDVAPSNENVEVAVEDSLSSWSARRRKRREQRLDISSATSSTENEKSSEEVKTPDEEEEKEIIQRTKAKLHVTHSSPALSELGSLGEYKLKLHLNGDNGGPTHEKEVIVEKEERKDEEHKETEVAVPRVKSRRSRSSRTGSSSTSSANEDAEIASSPIDDKLPSVTADDVSVEIVMEFVSERDDANEEANQEDQSESVDTRVTENERKVQETTEVDEKRESKDDEEEDIDVDAVEANEGEKVEVSVDDAHDLADDDEDILENKDAAEEEQSQINGDNIAETTIYKDEPVESQPLTETLEEKAVEPGKVTAPDPDKPAEEPKRRNREERKESSTDEPETVKPARRTRRKEVEEEKPRRRNRNRKIEEETPKEEKKESTDRAEEKENEQKQPEEPVAETENLPVSKDESPAEPESKSEEKSPAEEPPKAMQPSMENLEEITDIKVLEKMLEVAKEYDDRRRIRSVIRALKRGEKPKVTKDPKYDSKSNGSLNALNLLASKRNEPATGDLAKNGVVPREGAEDSRFVSSRTTVTQVEKTDRGARFTSTTVEKTTRMTSGQKKIGSIFDRGDDEDVKPKSRGSSRMADLERRQAERRRELQRNRSMPASSSSKDARKAFVAKLEAGAPKASTGKKVGRSPTFVVPNANNVKQLLLKWCQSKTRGYEHVDIMNFSSSWASGMAFCALVHNFFPDAFDYSKLDPQNKAENLELAFTKADEHGEIPQLLDAEDMIRMAEPDWKCVYTYIGEFYKRIRDLGLN